MALNKYTQADVEAMSDAELSRLASGLRFGEEITWDIWSPATDRNQSGELLQFAAYKMGMDYTFISDMHTYVQIEQRELPCTWNKIIAVKGATARSETIAAVCALLALEGRLA